VRTFAFVALAALLVAACTGDSTDDEPNLDAPTVSLGAVEARVDALADQVDRWENATDYAEASGAAEAAANLVVGPDGPGYGDRNGDGVVEGESERGLLTGETGLHGLIIETIGSASCVEPDALGGSWQDPAARWAQLEDVLSRWTSSNNTMPELASHPMRVVGWATLTLQSEDVDLAHEYAGHAQIHVAVTERALGDC
jgi:hypothetical protein